MYMSVGSDGNVTCIACPSECQNCLQESVCLSCEANFVLMPNLTCVPRCGDGIIAGN
jgi:hypothetical protein